MLGFSSKKKTPRRFSPSLSGTLGELPPMQEASAAPPARDHRPLPTERTRASSSRGRRQNAAPELTGSTKGRQPNGSTDTNLTIRLPSHEKAIIRRIAEARGTTVTRLLLDAVILVRDSEDLDV